MLGRSRATKGASWLVLLAAVVAGCGAADASTGDGWREVAPPTTSGSVYRTFADVAGVWRCRETTCEQFSWSGKPLTKVSLPCRVDAFAASPSGTRIAQRCGGELVVISLPGGKPALPRRRLAEVDELAVDDAGVVTGTRNAQEKYAPDDEEEEKVIGWNPAIAVRIGVDGTTRRFELVPPADAIDPKDKATVHPAIGAWLASSDGAYHREVAWRASRPPTQILMKGGALWNGEKLWISTMDSGYQRMTDQGPVPTKHRFGGGLPGHGILHGVAPWGRAGLIAFYETAMLLLDGELATKRTLTFARPSVDDPLYDVISDPSGRHVCIVTVYGGIRCATL